MSVEENGNNYDIVAEEEGENVKSAESTLSSSSQKDDTNSSLSFPSTSGAIMSEEVQILVDLIDRAASSYSEGNLEMALHYYEQAIMIDPGNNVLYANKSAILLKLGRIKEAIEEATHSIQLKPEWPKAYFRKAEALKEAKEFEKAIISYCQAIQTNPESQRFLSSLILCTKKSIIKDHFEAAYKQMKELGLEKSQFVTISVIGQQFLEINDSITAISILRIALNIDSPSLKLKESTLGALAKAYFEAKNYNKAIDYLELQLELVTQLKDIKTAMQVHENISEIAENHLEDFQLALVHRDSQLRLCCQLCLPVASILCSKGAIYEKMNLDDCSIISAAEECYQLALKEDIKNYGANFGIGNILFKQNKISEALEAFIKAHEVAPSQDYRQLALIRLCQCKLILGQTEEAINLLKINLKTETSLNPHILGNILGILCRAAEASDDVITFYRMAKRQLKLAMETKNNLLKSEAFYSLAKFYDRTNQKSNAKRLFELYLEIIETSEIKHHNLEQEILALLKLGRIEFEGGNWEVAISMAQKRLLLTQKIKNIEMEAIAHADLISIYRKMANMEKCENHIKALEALTTIAPENTILQVVSIYDIEMAEMFIETQKWDKAKEILERALIVIQELDNTEKEAEMCEKLGLVHFKMGENDEAIIYFNQFLMISQQQRNPNFMLNAYAQLTQVHIKLENWDEAFDCAKFLLTLSDILNNQKQKVIAYLAIGRSFSKKDEHQIAIKVLSKARRLAEKIDAKRELALCFGYLGESQLKLNQRQKALTNFCKQLNYFPYISDAKDKCETIGYLIEEKILNNDVIWCAKLCHLQEDIAKEGGGSINLQMKVLRDSASKMHSLGCLDETIKSMEKALMLSIENEHPDTVTILLELCEYYCEIEKYHKATLALKEFAELQDGICGPDVYYQLSIMLLTQNKINESIENLEKCQTFDAVDNRFMYAFSCAYFRKGDYEISYSWLMQYIEANFFNTTAVNDDETENDNTKNILHEKLLWERCLLDYLCGNYDLALNELKLLIRTNIGPILEFLDAFNFYRELEPEMEILLPLDCQIHYAIAIGDYEKAKQFLELNSIKNANFIFENVAVSLLLGYQSSITVDASLYDFSSEPYTLYLFKTLPQQIRNATAAILAINNSQTFIESIHCIEILRWAETFHDFIKAGRNDFICSEPTYEDIKNAIDGSTNFVYCFQIDDILLIWIKNNFGNFEFFYKLETFSNYSMPQFYTDTLKKVLHNLQIPLISEETFNSYLLNSDTCIGCDAFQKNNLYSLTFSSSSVMNEKFPEALALFVFDSRQSENNTSTINNIIELKVTPELSKNEILKRIQQTSIVFLNLDNVSEELLHHMDLLEASPLLTQLCVLNSSIINERIMKVAKNLILNGCQWVIVITDGEEGKKLLKKLLQSDFPKKIHIELVKDMFQSLRPIYFTNLKSNRFIEIYGLSSASRNILCDSDNLQNFLKIGNEFATDSFEFALYERVKQLSSLHNETIAADQIEEIRHLNQEPFPFHKIREFLHKYEDQENVSLLFADMIPPRNWNENQNLDSTELFQLMKSFEVRTRWRRRKKGKMPSRDYCSDGERFSLLSDKELTDSESISGARVIGFDVEDGSEYKY